VVAAELARRCEIQVAYAIGVAEPVAIYVDTFGTGRCDENAIARAVREVFDFRPRRLIEDLGLRSPIFRATAAYGHFGRPARSERNGERELHYFTWEAIDAGRLEELRRRCS
jgi:S-adenosylmethionine synthetase